MGRSQLVFRHVKEHPISVVHQLPNACTIAVSGACAVQHVTGHGIKVHSCCVYTQQQDHDIHQMQQHHDIHDVHENLSYGFPETLSVQLTLRRSRQRVVHVGKQVVRDRDQALHDAQQQHGARERELHTALDEARRGANALEDRCAAQATELDGVRSCMEQHRSQLQVRGAASHPEAAGEHPIFAVLRHSVRTTRTSEW